MPSATTNSGARTKALSSLSRRWRPVSVFQIVSAARSMLVRVSTAEWSSLQVGELAVADPNPIAVVQRLWSGKRFLVQIGAVGGAEILDHQDVSLTGDLRVTGG